MTRQKRPLSSAILALSLILCLTVAAPVAHATEAVSAPEEVLTDTSDDCCAAVDLSGGMAETMSTVPGSAACLVAKAKSQVGNSYSVYGFPASGGWCARFISWCASYSNIASNVIPRYPQYASPSQFQAFYESHGRYYSVYDVGVTESIRVGDICFTAQPNSSSIEYGSIVRSISGTTVYTIDGSLQGQVQERSYRFYEEAAGTRDVDGVVGFAHPAYGSSSHSRTWQFDEDSHWGSCTNCDSYASAAHSITATGACSVCRYDPNITINKQPGFVTESQTPWKPEE